MLTLNRICKKKKTQIKFISLVIAVRRFFKNCHNYPIVTLNSMDHLEKYSVFGNKFSFNIKE